MTGTTLGLAGGKPRPRLASALTSRSAAASHTGDGTQSRSQEGILTPLTIRCRALVYAVFDFGGVNG